MFCTQCGTKSASAAEFCQKCGAKLETAVQPTSPSITAPSVAMPSGAVTKVPPPITEINAPSLWNPAALANWSLFLTPLFGSYLLAENYKAMGKPKEAKKAMEWFYLGIAIFLSVFLLSPSGLFGVALLTYLLYLVSWNFMSARKQQRAVLSEYGNNYERQPWGKVLTIGIAAIIVWQIIVRAPSSNVTSSLFPTTSFDSAEVKRVKSGVMQLCPSHTVDQMVKGFMGSPSWKSGKSADGKVFVNVEGDITFQDKPVRAMVQFIVEGESFSFSAFEMNGVPSANLIAIGLLNKMCASAEGSVAEKTAAKAPEAPAPLPVDVAPEPAASTAPVEKIFLLDGLEGKWNRLGDTTSGSSFITIKNVSATVFAFEILASSGNNTGIIEGVARKNDSNVFFRDEESKCEVEFLRKGDHLLLSTSKNCSGFGGMGVTFDGEYWKG